MNTKNKIKGYISLAKKSNNLIIGFDNIKNQLANLNLILVSQDASEKLLKEINFFSNKYNLDCIQVNHDELVFYTQIDKCKVIAILNSGIASQIKMLIKE